MQQVRAAHLRQVRGADAGRLPLQGLRACPAADLLRRFPSHPLPGRCCGRAAWLVPSLGWYAIVLGPLAGVGIAEVVRWAVRGQRGQYTWLIVCGCILVGALPQVLRSLFSLFTSAVGPAGGGYYIGGLMRLVWTIVYLVAATGAAYARVRPGRRV